MKLGWIDIDKCLASAVVILSQIFARHEISSIKPLESCNSQTFEVNDDWIIKVPTDEFEARDILKEIEIAKVLAHADLPVPVSLPEAHDIMLELNHGAPVRVRCAVMKKLPGKHPDSNCISATLAAEVGTFLAALHAIPVNPNGRITSEWGECVQSILNSTSSDLNFCQQLKSSVFLPFYTQYMNITHPVLCHGDIYKNNILVDEGGHLAGVIDFGCATIAGRGNETIDCAFLKPELFKAYRKAAGVDLFNGTGENAKVSDLFHRMNIVCLKQKILWKDRTRN